MKANFFKLWSIDTADDYFMQGIYSSKDKLLLYNFGKQPEINMKLVFQWLLSYELQCNEINFAHTFSAAADKQPMISFEKKNKYFEIHMFHGFWAEYSILSPRPATLI